MIFVHYLYSGRTVPLDRERERERETPKGFIPTLNKTETAH